MSEFSFLSTFPPTRCGIATFTQSLADALGASSSIVRLLDPTDSRSSVELGGGHRVVGEWGDGRGSAADAARELAAGAVAVVQHEYGIYPGRDGDEVVHVLGALERPSILVLHTILQNPTTHQREVLERAVALATRTVVMTDVAHRALVSGYAVDRAKVTVIPHGAPVWDGIDATGIDPTDLDPTGIGVPATMLTWGLIGPGKGIEWGIRALAELVEECTGLRYEVLGETHPKVLARDGEAYREDLYRLAEDLGVADRVTFDGRYLDRDSLATRVAAARLVLLPYDSPTQVTSGVLVEAIAAGKPVVATRFPHARELLGSGGGTLVEHRSASAIATAVRDLLHVPGGVLPRPSVGSRLTWSEVAERYRGLAQRIAAPNVARSA